MAGTTPLHIKIAPDLKRRAEAAAEASSPPRTLTFFVAQALERLLQEEATAKSYAGTVSGPRRLRKGGR